MCVRRICAVKDLLELIHHLEDKNVIEVVFLLQGVFNEIVEFLDRNQCNCRE